MKRDVIDFYQFYRGKLHVATTIIGDVSRVYRDFPEIQLKLSAAFRALTLADAALIAESQKPSPNTRKPSLKRTAVR